ncbi:hypothetical protein SKAU_G00215220 [Synaphobranchus kaupii]|uniref:Uncharacterized protein n=1 Tax=Synaphobranchus kaupii TaxID=118154 RepID=A0A9Q1ITB5_SYNKA|nr:hypothetical protein SKAU_G00215220 [Synaphobranchus kaupii]
MPNGLAISVRLPADISVALPGPCGDWLARTGGNKADKPPGSAGLWAEDDTERHSSCQSVIGPSEQRTSSDTLEKLFSIKFLLVRQEPCRAVMNGICSEWHVRWLPTDPGIDECRRVWLLEVGRRERRCHMGTNVPPPPRSGAWSDAPPPRQLRVIAAQVLFIHNSAGIWVIGFPP